MPAIVDILFYGIDFYRHGKAVGCRFVSKAG